MTSVVIYALTYSEIYKKYDFYPAFADYFFVECMQPLRFGADGPAV